MRTAGLHIILALTLLLSLMSCDKTPRGVLSVNEMADLIVDLQLAEAYMNSHGAEYSSDSSMQVMKQSVFMKHGITQQDYDSSMVWYAHNMEDYVKAYDKAAGKLKERYDKLGKKVGGNERPGELASMPGEIKGGPSHDALPKPNKHLRKVRDNIMSDSTDLWHGNRAYALTQGSRRGFITFDTPPDANKKPGDRYQLAYKLTRGGNEFKVSLNIDYTDGTTAQIARSTNSDGWVMIDIQSDTTRSVRRIYGFVSYDMKKGHIAYVDSLMLMRTHLSKSNYGFIHAQRLFERNK